jgi:hypothetical protein
MIRVAVYVAHLSIAQMDAYPAAARAHITGRFAYLVLGIRRRRFERIVQRDYRALRIAKIMRFHQASQLI